MKGKRTRSERLLPSHRHPRDVDDIPLSFLLSSGRRVTLLEAAIWHTFASEQYCNQRTKSNGIFDAESAVNDEEPDTRLQRRALRLRNVEMMTLEASTKGFALKGDENETLESREARLRRPGDSRDSSLSTRCSWTVRATKLIRIHTAYNPTPAHPSVREGLRLLLRHPLLLPLVHIHLRMPVDPAQCLRLGLAGQSRVGTQDVRAASGDPEEFEDEGGELRSKQGSAQLKHDAASERTLTSA